MTAAYSLQKNKFGWSVLPPVPLLGLGTPLVESAEHYVARLAWISGTSIRQLCGYMSCCNGMRQIVVGGLNKFCGPGSVYKHRVSELEKLTGISTIRCGTFMVLDKVLCEWAIGRTSYRRKWCPECYLRWDQTSSWEPLLWQIELVNKCPIHDCDLVSGCRKCGASQQQVVAYHRRRNCWRCKKSLGRPGRTEQRPSYYAWAQSQICDLVQLCGTPGEDPVPADAISRFVYGIPAFTAHRSKIPGVVKDAIARSKNRSRQVASLETIVNLCGLQGVRPVDMLRDPIGAASRPLLDMWSGDRLLDLLLPALAKS